MPPLRALLQPPPTAPASPPRPQGPLSVADRLMTLAQGLMGVNQPEPTDFQTPQDFGQADYWHGLGEMLGLAPALVAPMMAIKAYHGSPHDFSSFDLSKIGTGEGAQAYGHGLYFAEKEGTAEAYRHALSDYSIELPSGKIGGKFMPVFTKTGPEDQALAWVQDAAHRGVPDPFSTGAIEARKAGKALGDNRYEEAASLIDSWKAQGARLAKGGRTYEVNIHASPDELLDWDKPLSQQPPKVQEAFTKVYGKSPEQLSPMSGAQAYEMAGHGDRTKAAEALKKAGIKGIQYLDQGSRASGEGTKNFVIFDDKIIEIAKKYGLALPAAASLYKWQQSQKGVE